MKRLGYYILYAIFLVLLLYFGSQTNQYLRVLVGRTFRPIPLVVFLSIYPIFIGIFLALPDFISKAKGQGRWTVDWIKLITIGTVSLFIALSPIIYWLSAIGHYAPPQFVLWLGQFNQAVTISGVVFGYLVLSISQKSFEDKKD